MMPVAEGTLEALYDLETGQGSRGLGSYSRAAAGAARAVGSATINTKWFHRIGLFALLAFMLPAVTRAADGDFCTSSLPTRTQAGFAPGATCKKLCDAKGTGAFSCNPMLVPTPLARCTSIRVETTGGCNFDDVVVAQMTTSATTGVEVKRLVTIDNDTPAPDGYAAFERTSGPLGPYLYVPSGTLSTCSTSTFAIWVIQWPCD